MGLQRVGHNWGIELKSHQTYIGCACSWSTFSITVLQGHSGAQVETETPSYCGHISPVSRWEVARRERWQWIRLSWVQNFDLPVTSSVTVANYLMSLSLSFFICKIEKISTYFPGKLLGRLLNKIIHKSMWQRVVTVSYCIRNCERNIINTLKVSSQEFWWYAKGSS